MDELCEAIVETTVMWLTCKTVRASNSGLGGRSWRIEPPRKKEFRREYVLVRISFDPFRPPYEMQKRTINS